jgi:hypothetical protein
MGLLRRVDDTAGLRNTSFPKTTQKKKQMQKNSQVRIKSAPRKRKQKAPSLSPVAALLNNPCGAPIPSGFFGDDSGYHMRLRSTAGINIYNNNNHKYGYIVWFPDYHCSSNNGGTTAKNANLFQWCSLDSTSTPTFTSMGTQVTTTTTPTTISSLEDPAYDFVVGTTCQDARTFAACMKVRYTGPTSSAKGNIFPLTNVPLELLLEAPSVSQLMAYANRDVRCDDTLEIKFRPIGRASGNYHKSTAGALRVVNAANAEVPASTEQVAPIGIGFVWRDISDANDLTVDYYKVIEWKPEPGSKIPSKPPRNGFTTELVRSGINALDRNMPGWDTVVGSIAGPAMGSLATILRRVVLSGSS